MTSKATIASRLPVRRGLGLSEAAVYLSLSPTKFREMVLAGEMPRARMIGGRRVWDVDDLDAVFKSLPYEGTVDSEDREWDEVL